MNRAVKESQQLAVQEAAPLDEVMLAMDVVDTLRHKELMLERELSADDRDQRLLERLREIYTAQGIEVTDEILAQGVRALREERFSYTGPEPGFARTLATLYVTRARWGKWLGGAAAAVVLAALAFQFFVRGPEQRALEQLPVELAAVHGEIVASTDEASALAEAERLRAAGLAAVDSREFGDARTALADLRGLDARLDQQYEIRVVSRPGESSGVYRIPDENEAARNYYLIVEAVTADGRVLELPITSEEDGRTRRVRSWGVRVDEATYERVAADKLDDGIIQQAVVGEKIAGELEPEFSIATPGGAITDW